MAASIYGRFYELRDIMRGLNGNRGGVVAGAQTDGPLPMPNIGPIIADMTGPRLNQMLPYHLQPHPRTGEAHYNQVLPGSS
jgi:hypothetical protein